MKSELIATLPDEHLDLLETIAAAMECSRNRVVEQAISDYIDNTLGKHGSKARPRQCDT